MFDTSRHAYSSPLFFSSLSIFIPCHSLPESSYSVFLVLKCLSLFFSSVQFSRSVVSDSSRPHESQHARPPCPSPTPRVHSDSRQEVPNSIYIQTPYLPEMLRGLKQTLCTPGPRDPTETETELHLNVSCVATGQQWTATGTGALGQQTWVWHKPS